MHVVILSGLPNRNLHAEISLVDNDGNEIATILQGRVDIGSDPFGAGALSVLKSWGIKIKTWSSMATAAVLTLKGTIQTGVDLDTQSWVGTDEVMTSGAGSWFTVVETDPPVGVEMSSTVPTNAHRKIQAVLVDVTAGSGQFGPTFDLEDDAGVQMWRTGTVKITGGQTRTFNLCIGSNREDPIGFDDSNVCAIEMPQINLDVGDVFHSDDITADDNYGAPAVRVVEWLVDHP